MKRYMVILLILLALLSLVACGEVRPALQTPTTPTETPAAGSATKPSELSIIHPTAKPTTPPAIREEPAWKQELSDYLVEEDGEYYLILPSSGKKLRILYAEYAPEDLERIDPALLMAAEAKLNYEMGAYDVDYHFYAAAYDGEIWLCVEAIRNIDSPNGENGCGIDHEHIMLEEKITK